MKKTIKYCIILSLLISLNTITTYAGWVDLTNRVRNETQLDERIRDLCREHAQGNQRSGDLRWIRVQRVDQNTFKVEAEAYARNRHHTGPACAKIPFDGKVCVGKGALIYDWTITVWASGLINTQSCILTITDTRIDGDRSGLLNQFRDSGRGKTEHIENCQHLLRGL